MGVSKSSKLSNQSNKSRELKKLQISTAYPGGKGNAVTAAAAAAAAALGLKVIKQATLIHNSMGLPHTITEIVILEAHSRPRCDESSKCSHCHPSVPRNRMLERKSKDPSV